MAGKQAGSSMNLLLLVGLLVCGGVAAREDPKIKKVTCMALIDQGDVSFTGFLFSSKTKQVGEIKSADTFKDNKEGTFPPDESKKNMFDAKKITEAADAAATAKDALATATEAKETDWQKEMGYGYSISLRRQIKAEATAAEGAAALDPLVNKQDGTFNPTTFNLESCSPQPSCEEGAIYHKGGGIPKKDIDKTTLALAGWYEQAIWAMVFKDHKENGNKQACEVKKIVFRQTGKIRDSLLTGSKKDKYTTKRSVAWVEKMTASLKVIPSFGEVKTFDVDVLLQAEEEKLQAVAQKKSAKSKKSSTASTASWATAFAAKNFPSGFFH